MFLFWGGQTSPKQKTRLPIQNLQPCTQSSKSKITPPCQKDNSDKSSFYEKHWIFFDTLMSLETLNLRKIAILLGTKNIAA